MTCDTCRRPVLIAWLSLLVWLSTPWFTTRLFAVPPTDGSIRIVRDVPYARHAAGTLQADVYLPVHEGPHPSVLVVHGGAWMAGNKSHAAWHARRLAQAGYAAVAIDYRLAPTYPFPAQLEDCRAALAWIGQQQTLGFDSSRVAAFGYSAGGHLVCLLATTSTAPVETTAPDPSTALPLELEVATESASTPQAAPSTAVAANIDPNHADLPRLPRLRAVVAGGAPCDFRDQQPHRQQLVFWLGGTRAEVPERYEQASPARYVGEQTPPIFLFHGDQDRLVPLASPRALFQSLQRAGVATELHIVPAAGHLQAYLDPTAFRAAVTFLDQMLKPRGESPARE